MMNETTFRPTAIAARAFALPARALYFSCNRAFPGPADQNSLVVSLNKNPTDNWCRLEGNPAAEQFALFRTRLVAWCLEKGRRCKQALLRTGRCADCKHDPDTDASSESEDTGGSGADADTGRKSVDAVVHMCKFTRWCVVVVARASYMYGGTCMV